MKLQVAIDRVDLERARELVERIAGEADIIEIGTSLTKEFGVRALEPLTRKATLLGDIKTCDEGKYEFDLGFACGFKYLTVMGSSSMGTLEACAASAAEHDGVMMIDLLECDEARIEKIAVFPDAVYCLHTSVDSGATKDPVAQVRAFKQRFPQIARIAIAGGIKQNQLSALAAEGLDIVIMGSAITKADDIQAACRACKEEMQ
ncbi:orotidine 5'-phosphate decarboxylase / HUMPS family protein [Bifidobacterium eulemuris]|uniref:Orotidine 5'-phosphate decarboxylase n=1 Tax=Bifidobacterium eulemuris TaxID=1765219 RepID=A0A261GAW5_9BIFI|nr:orotidine 5'-phosphate decarboxylase / HUMPS family protein [Bifidobacterium eulemuris]OZG68116.1 sugar decarboxylase or lyase/synthase [Bifidobacterium eulemuris]QOL31818.1 orotidine 5'-phosphate decarboxylase [Bifidobacterium eulemuris]